MTTVIGVRFRTAGKIYFFAPGELDIKKGDHVIVETARGIEYGTVVSPITDVEDDKIVAPIKTVIRIANEQDEIQEKNNKAKEKDAFKICQEKIKKHGLEMKLIDAEYTFDNNKILFYFTADGRIDFRALVKDLAAVFRTRIELRQIGVRDETKIIGGYGICGRVLCCHSYLSDFAPVSIKMAKEQSLSLNPTKISGVCGRLMCCLKNEEDVYEELNEKLPKIGDIVATDDGLEGEVANVGVLRQTVRILVDVNDEKEVHEYPAEKVHFVRKKAKSKLENAKEEEEVDLEELKALEDSGTSGNLDDDSNENVGKDDRRNHRPAKNYNRQSQRHEKRDFRNGSANGQTGANQENNGYKKHNQGNNYAHKNFKNHKVHNNNNINNNANNNNANNNNANK